MRKTVMLVKWCHTELQSPFLFGVLFHDSIFPFSPHPNRNRRTQPNCTEHVDRQVTRECIKQSVPVVDGTDGVDEGVVEGAGEDAFRGLVDGCHGK